MTLNYPRLLPNGDAAVSVEFGDSIDTKVNASVLAFDLAVQQAGMPGVIETVPTYRALMVHLDPLTADHSKLFDALLQLARGTLPQSDNKRRWTVPVVYGGAHGKDLKALAQQHGMTSKEVVDIHLLTIYRVYMVGFMPGFTYLGGLDARLHTPRRPEPRLQIPGGSISIGGAQTAIGAAPSPSGWHLIGRTPVRCFVAEREPAFLFEAGDEVVFQAEDAGRWDTLKAASAAGELIANCEVF
jgi:KipI family sensor histidine kinase inhibitor